MLNDEVGSQRKKIREDVARLKQETATNAQARLRFEQDNQHNKILARYLAHPSGRPLDHERVESKTSAGPAAQLSRVTSKASVLPASPEAGDGRSRSPASTLHRSASGASLSRGKRRGRGLTSSSSRADVLRATGRTLPRSGSSLSTSPSTRSLASHGSSKSLRSVGSMRRVHSAQSLHATSSWRSSGKSPLAQQGRRFVFPALESHGHGVDSHAFVTLRSVWPPRLRVSRNPMLLLLVGWLLVVANQVSSVEPLPSPGTWMRCVTKRVARHSPHSPMIYGSLCRVVASSCRASSGRCYPPLATRHGPQDATPAPLALGNRRTCRPTSCTLLVGVLRWGLLHPRTPPTSTRRRPLHGGAERTIGAPARPHTQR